MSGSQWKEHLQAVAPAGWEFALALPFTIAAGGKVLEWECMGSRSEGDDLIEEYRAGAWWLGARYLRYGKPRAWVVKLELACESEGEALTLIEPMRLRWKAADARPSYARTVGGGVNEKVYPPHAFRLDTMRLDPGAFCWTENGWDGRSSNKDMPMLIGAVGGDGFVGTLEWSGYWWGSIARGHQQEYTLQIKVPVNGVKLVAGEKLELPVAHYVFGDGGTGGLDGATNAFRRYLNEVVLPRKVMPTVNYNHWFGLGPDVNEELMLRLVPLAARAGAEYFVLDAGWYAGCKGNDFEMGVGNLEVVDRAKFPRGLRPLAQKVRAAGMGFGLWFELERAHRTSDWVKRHPEWFIDTGGEYLHLDLSVREAQDACIAVMTNAVRELGLKWVKLDYNTGPKPYWEKKDPTGKIQFAYVQGLYRVLDEFVRQCPEVIMECCASGGRRLDLGILRRAHEAWISDESMSSENVRYMQAGANYLLPGQLNNECIPFGKSEGSTTFGDYDVVCRMLGSLAFHGDLTALESEDIDRLGRLSEMYKTVRHLLSEDFHALLPQPATDAQWEAVEFVRGDGSEAVIFVYSGAEELAEPLPAIRAKGLDAEAEYTVRRLAGATKQMMGGAELMREGLQVKLGARQVAIWHMANAG